MGFLEYIESLKEINLGDKDKNFHVVIGNESCDLDSAVCALVTGYFLSKTDDDVPIPVLNIPRCDYHLKTEVQYLLNELNIKASSLFFLDDINLANLHQEGRLKVTLVDHNVLSHSLAALEIAVIRVIDHHKWERKASDMLDIHWAETGSCAALVGEMILSTREDIIDKTVAKLLQSAIIVDTLNFSETAKKFRPTDVDVFSRLKSGYTADLDWTAEYKKLEKAKRDIKALSVCQLLRKDLKVVREKISIAIPSVPASLDEFLALENVEKQLEHFRQRENVDSVVVMISKCRLDELGRSLILFGTDACLAEAILRKLETFADPSLQLEPINISTKCFTNRRFTVFILRQKNVAASRKVVLPLLKEFASSYE